ncbi:MAG: L,D-transpeptidase [Actinobacteria bacterium]|nr:MAG: L,D-transpeptidase [Actinomycetota bacterium]
MRRYAAALLAGACSIAAPSACVAEGPAAAATLSNLTTLSRWAYPQAAAPVYAAPAAASRVIGHLRFLTAEGQAQAYLILRSYSAGGITWLRVPVPDPSNRLAGWVEAGALGEMHITREHLRINRELLRATLYRDGRAIWSAAVGVGRPSSPTPAGRFYITEKLLTTGGAFYGPFALGTSAYASARSDWPGGKVVGIHGTDAPQLVPGRPSHGCIRLRNADVTRLWSVVDVGTPIEIV